MSSFIAKLKHPITKKKQKALCIDDFYGKHRYGYLFRKNGEDCDWEGFYKINKSIENILEDFEYQVFTEDEVLKVNKKII